MTFAEVLSRAMEKEKDRDGGFVFQLVILEVSKASGKRKAYMKLQINDEIAEHVFKNLDSEAQF